METNGRSPRRGGDPVPGGSLERLLADFAAFLAEPPGHRDPGTRPRRGRARSDREVLARLLDRLAAARTACPSAAHPLGPLPPQDGTGRRERMAARFPRLGYYATVEPVLGSGGTEARAPEAPVIADAIDDLVDLSEELERVAWYLVHGGREDAARYFAWSHDVHWGRHLRELQLYLHALGE